MTKTEFTKYFAENAEISHKKAAELINTMLDCLAGALQEHEDIEFKGFGAFRTEYKEDAVKRNPMNGEDVFVPAHYILKFKPSMKLKNAVK